MSQTHDNLLEVLNLHLNILHAEMQAISARDLNLIENILHQKDESLKILLSAKNRVDSDLDFPPNIMALISSVLSLQEKNANNFRELHIQKEGRINPSGASNTLSNRIAKAYRR